MKKRYSDVFRLEKNAFDSRLRKFFGGIGESAAACTGH